MQEKICSICYTMKPFDEFHRDKTAKDGHYSICIICKNKAHRKYYRKNSPYGEAPKLTISERFWIKVEKSDKCWEWQGCRFSNGYGRFTTRAPYKQNLAHRFAYILTFGEIPYNLMVLHKCDNPPCVRPDHLFLGTCQDNANDRVNKGRSLKGEQHPSAILTEKQIREIRSLRNIRPQWELALEFNIKQVTVSDIQRRKRWKHVN